MRLRRPRPARTLGRLALLLALVAPAPALHAQPAGESVTLTLPQVRAAIVAAAARGDRRTVRLLAEGLAGTGKADGQVYYLWAEAEAAAGGHARALEAAKQAYRLAGTDQQRFQAAQVAARAAHDGGQTTTAQLWLRRTYEHAGDARTRDAIARDYRTLRAINPLQFRLSFGISPSSNVNNGSESRLNFIDGVPVVGVLSPEAQALSGIETTADLAVGYRLGAPQPTRQITAVARLFTRQVRLSEEARERAPAAGNGDFAFSLAQAGLRAQFAPAAGRRIGAGLVAGQSWYGGARYYKFGRLEGEWSQTLAPATRLGVAGYAEKRFHDKSALTEEIAQIGLSLGHVLPSGGVLRGRVTAQNDNTTGRSRDNHALSVALDWTPARALGPVSLSFGISASYTDFPDYRVGFIAVPGGRQDRTVAAEITVDFDRVDYAGFIPTMDIGLRRTRSNVSRFDTEEITLGLGIRSAF